MWKAIVEWVRWVLCPHDWQFKWRKEYYGSHDTKNTLPTGELELWQCAKCTRFKKIKT